MQVAEKNRGRLAQSKGLANPVSVELSGAPSGLVGRLKRGEAYPLIPRRLLTKFLTRIGQGLLDLKDLLTAFPPRLKGLFENEPFLRGSLVTKSYQILPFFAKNVPRTGSNRHIRGR